MLNILNAGELNIKQGNALEEIIKQHLATKEQRKLFNYYSEAKRLRLNYRKEFLHGRRYWRDVLRGKKAM